MNLLLWSLKFCWAQDRWKPCSSLIEGLSGMTCIQSREQENTPGQKASSLLTSIKYKASSGFDPLGSSKTWYRWRKGMGWFLGVIPEKLKIWPIFEYMTIYQPLLYDLIMCDHLFSLKKQETKCFNGDFSSFCHFQVTYFSKIFSKYKGNAFWSSLSLLPQKYRILALEHGGRRVTPLERGHTTSRKEPRAQEHWPRVCNEGLPTLEWSNMQGSGPRGLADTTRDLQVAEFLGIRWCLRHGQWKMLEAGFNAKKRDSGNQAGRIKVHGQANGSWLGGGRELRNKEDKADQVDPYLITLPCPWIFLRFYLQALNQSSSDLCPLDEPARKTSSINSPIYLSFHILGLTTV